ncbi:VOC family protein [Pseudonocardia sp. ICBG601]|uniref:VOC family protein n=1 Tax=Pseudonocardia sp. ICBG601 TaxID=2846759 RepID=UPI001CF67B16|nr:VOC family protein [Pseudonocardia sp. ICBG601]
MTPPTPPTTTTAPAAERLITHLRHVDLAVPDLAAQQAFYTGAWGLTEVHTDTGLSFLAAEGSPEQYIVRLREAADKRIDLIAFGAATAADVDTLAARLGRAGVRLVSEPGAVPTPGGGYGFRFSTTRAAPSRSPPTSRCARTAGSRRASPSRSGCPTS